jgi:hypothetical protein
VMSQVDLGLTAVGRFDSADSIISINNTKQKPGVSQGQERLHLRKTLSKLTLMDGPASRPGGRSGCSP